jgi:hypothetical protein
MENWSLKNKKLMLQSYIMELYSAGALSELKSSQLFSPDPDRIGLLGKPLAAEHSFPSKSQ